MRLLQVEKEESLAFNQRLAAFTKSWQRHWTTEVEAPVVEAIKRSLQTRLIVEEVGGIEGFIAKEVVSSAGILPSAALRDDIDHGAAVVAIFRTVVIAQYFDLADSIQTGSQT